MFKSLGKGDIAIDCGANVGKFTELMARGGATVYAIEPNPHAFAVLVKRFEGRANVTCLNVAVHVENTTLPLYFHVNSETDPVLWSTGSSIMANKSNVRKDSGAQVEAIDFSEFLRKFGRRIALVKMDIEGAEADVLRHIIDDGSIRLIDRMFVETHEKKMPELREKMERIREDIASLGLNRVHLDWI